MDKKTLVALVVLVALVIAFVYFKGRENRHAITFKDASGKTTTLTVK